MLLGVPTYDDAGVGYHLPSVEHLPNALLGIHAGLSGYRTPPDHYQGVAIYCEWETDDAEWQYWREHFLRLPHLQAPRGAGQGPIPDQFLPRLNWSIFAAV